MLVGLLLSMTAVADGPSARAIYDAGATCPRILTNNDILEPDLHVVNEIHHTLTIKNGGHDAAFVSVVEQNRGERVLFFVQKGMSTTIALDDGDYIIKYALSGKLAADCSSVIRPSWVGEFPGVNHLKITADSTGYTTNVLEYTLYSVPHGNVRPKKISTAEFNRD